MMETVQFISDYRMIIMPLMILAEMVALGYVLWDFFFKGMLEELKGQ